MDFSQSALFFDLSFHFVILYYYYYYYLVFILISFILIHCPGRFHSVWLYHGHNLGFLNVSSFTVTVVGLSPSPQRARPVHHIYNPLGQGGSAISPGTGYPFWSPFTTCLDCSGTILFPGHHTGSFVTILNVNICYNSDLKDIICRNFHLYTNSLH